MKILLSTVVLVILFLASCAPSTTNTQQSNVLCPYPKAGSNWEFLELSAQEREVVKASLQCFLDQDSTVQGEAKRRRGIKPIEDVLREYQKDSKWRRTWAFETSTKPPFIPKLGFSQDEYDNAYRFLDCFYACGNFKADIGIQKIENGKYEIRAGENLPSLDGIIIDTVNLTVHTPLGLLDTDDFVAFDQSHGYGFSWREDSVTESPILREVFGFTANQPSERKTFTNEFIVWRDANSGKTVFTVYFREIGKDESILTGYDFVDLKYFFPN